MDPETTPWEIVGNPVMFQAGGVGGSLKGWKWMLARRSGGLRPLDVIVEMNGSDLRLLPPECELAINTAGRSAVEAVLDMAAPPTSIAITDTGLEHG